MINNLHTYYYIILVIITVIIFIIDIVMFSFGLLYYNHLLEFKNKSHFSSSNRSSSLGYQITIFVYAQNMVKFLPQAACCCPHIS